MRSRPAHRIVTRTPDGSRIPVAADDGEDHPQAAQVWLSSHRWNAALRLHPCKIVAPCVNCRVELARIRAHLRLVTALY